MSQPDTCDLCGEAVPDHAWFGLEVQRPVESPPHVEHDDFDQLDVIFCSQEHAASWLAAPIPDPEPVLHARTAGDRLFGLGCGLVLLLLAALMAVGGWTVAGWVGWIG